MKRPHVLIINRSSVVAGAALSRSVEERLFEPLQSLSRTDLIQLSVLNELEAISKNLSQYSHVVFNRGHSLISSELAHRAKKTGIIVISDLDDIPIYLPEGDSAYLNEEKQKSFLDILGASDIITCSTSKIKEWSNSNFNLKHSVLVPTGFDFEKFDREKKGGFNESHILFTNAGSLKLGSFSSAWLNTMNEWLQKKNWRLSVYADFINYFPQQFPLVNKGSALWLQHKLQINQAYPLAVVPLAGNEDAKHLKYSIYKTPVKYIIYGGLGICAIYSKTPIYESVIKNRFNGYLAENSPESWMTALDEAVNEREQTKKIVQNAMADVRERYSKKVAVESWKQIFLS